MLILVLFGLRAKPALAMDFADILHLLDHGSVPCSSIFARPQSLKWPDNSQNIREMITCIGAKLESTVFLRTNILCWNL